jgi:histidinol dehydrogenase
MRKHLHANAPDFYDSLVALLQSRHANNHDVSGTVRDIITRVRTAGDDAVIALSKQFDHTTLTPATMRVPEGDIRSRAATISAPLREAIALSAERIRTYHTAQLPANHRYTDTTGVTLGWQYAPLASVGLYVPGGKASYPSSVLMNAIPAQVAGVERIAMVVPTPYGECNPAIFAAAQEAGITEIYTIGGAQAVAALAYGTDSIAPVDKIVGPGNAYVAEAKRQVFGTVGIDTIAGPSEILVVADAQNDPRWIAADLLSQAEHDEMAQSILITNKAAFADAVAQEIEALLTALPKSDIARASWNRHGGMIIVDHFTDALPIIAEIAPEHLELAVEDPDAMVPHIYGAGAIFLGRYTPEAMGDYIAGPSHVLPTSRAARFSSGLSVFDFLNRSSIIGCTADACAALLEPAALIADSEGLAAHAVSLRVRRPE